MKVALSLFSALLAVFARADSLFSNQVQLSEGNWAENIVPGPENMWLVTFYVPWCHAAQELSPIIHPVIEDLRAKKFRMNFGAVDVEKNPKLGQMFNVVASPTLKMITFDKEGRILAEDFNGGNDQVGQFCETQYRAKNIPYSAIPEEFGDGEIVHLDDDNFDDVVLNSNEIWMIKFGAPWCYHCNVAKPHWAAAAKEMEGKVRFAMIDADKNRGLAKRFKISKLPTLKYYKSGYDKTDDSVLSYTGKRTEAPIIDFAKTLHDEYLATALAP